MRLYSARVPHCPVGSGRKWGLGSLMGYWGKGGGRPRPLSHSPIPPLSHSAVTKGEAAEDEEERVPMTFPDLYEIRQRLDDRQVADAAGGVQAALEALPAVPLHGRVAITAGSRGIDRIPEILAAVAAWVRERGGDPFVLAAMGSHGGSTDAGQAQVLHSYGITEDAVGCPVRACVRSRPVGALPDGTPALAGDLACEAEGIVVVNRVKPHTILTGAQGSGLMKMIAIGLGGPAGADGIHERGLAAALLPTARILLRHLPVLFGLSLVENAFDRVCAIEAVLPEAFEESDGRLLRRARALLPGIPFDPVDLLVVRRMGKNISGAGMDPNVIGMHRRLGGAPDRHIERIVALDLTDETHGNAIGVGMADIITERLKARIDWPATYANGLTSGFLAGIKCPVALPTDRDVLAVGLRGFPPEKARVVLIADTAHLDRLFVSGALLADARSDERLEVSEAPAPLQFGPAGELTAPR